MNKEIPIAEEIRMPFPIPENIAPIMHILCDYNRIDWELSSDKTKKEYGDEESDTAKTI